MWSSGALLRLAAARGAVILCFHRISPQRFEGWMERLTRAYTVVSLDELVSRRERGAPIERLLAVTFDDGWRDTCEPIAVVCEAARWPITIFLMTSLLDGEQRFWFAELEELLEAAAGARVRVGDLMVDLRPPHAAESRAALIRRLRSVPRTAAIELIDELAAASGAAWQPSTIPVFVDRGFVRAHRDSHFVTFGSHTIDHQALSAQSPRAIAAQLETSRSRLEDAVGKPIAHFCYPYGDADAVGLVAPREVPKHYRSAMTMIRGVCTKSSRLPYLPRVPLYDTDNDVRMVAKLLCAGAGF